MIQLELTDDDTEQLALICDQCLRAWHRHPDTTGDALRNRATDHGWTIDALGDLCPRCTKKETAI